MALDKILEKIAISNELRRRADIERGARVGASADVDKIHRADPLYNKHQGTQTFGVSGPAPKKKLVGPTMEDTLKRRKEIVNNLHSHPGKEYTLNKHIKNVKQKKLIGKGVKGLLAAGAIGGGAYGGKKLYDKLTEKTAFSNPGIFRNLAKQNSVNALENLGLGVLAVPSAQTMLDPSASEHDKSHAKYELGGLGILAAHPTHEIYNSLKENAPQIRGAVQEGLTSKVAPHLTNMGTNLMEHTSPMVRSVGQGISNLAGKIRFR